jgi:predicted ester cyclase
MGLPSTGKRTTFSANYIARVANDQIMDIWLSWERRER